MDNDLITNDLNSFSTPNLELLIFVLVQKYNWSLIDEASCYVSSILQHFIWSIDYFGKFRENIIFRKN